MNINQKLIAATVVVVGGAALAIFTSLYGSENALFERYPDIDPKIVIKVHREMVRESLKGKYSDRVLDDAAYDAIFLEKVQKYSAK